MRFPTRPPNPSFVPFFYYLFGAFPPTVSAPDRARPELRKEAKKKAQGLGKKRKQGASSPRLKEGAHPSCYKNFFTPTTFPCISNMGSVLKLPSFPIK